MLLHLNGRTVDLRRGSVTDDAGHSITTLRPQAGEILKVLAAKPGEIVTKDELMQTVWGNIAVSDDSLVQCVIEIRKALGDEKHRILQTLPKRGYVLDAKAIDNSRNAIGAFSATPRNASWIGLAAGLAVLVIAAAVYFWPLVRGSEAVRQAIAVLPLENTNGDPAGESARERAKVAVLEEDLLAARRELDSIRRTAYRAGAQVRAAADAKAAQGRAFEDQRQRADQLAGSLALTQREVELLKVEAVQNREAAENSLAQAKRALDEERQKVGLLERDLSVAHQSMDALEASSKVAATVQATATERRQAAEAALMRAGEALALERNRTETLTHELDTARREDNAARDNVVPVSTAIREALEQERDRATSLARELTAARSRIDNLTGPSAHLAYASKTRDTDSVDRRATASVAMRARSAPKSGSQEIRKMDGRKLLLPVGLTPSSLPGALLPAQ
jgi:DNA-binding winged helix-turn-helix (wHTH) protein